MQPWRDLMQRIRAIAPADTPAAYLNAVHTFNEANIGHKLPDLVLLMTNLLAEDFVKMQKSPVTWPYWLGAVVLGAVAVGCAVATTASAAEVAGALVGAAAAQFRSTKSAGPSFGQLFGSLIALIAGGFGSYGASWSALAIHLKTESFRTASSAYSDQLKKMASSMGLHDAPPTTRLLETQLAAVELPNDAKQRPLFAAFSKVMQTLVRLEEACKAIVFIVLNGDQHVGKSWFIRALNSTRQEARESTTSPSFLRYAPMADDPTRKVYLIDIPGNNTLNEVQAQYTAGLHGVGTIGISLLQFDKTPHVLPAAAIRSAFNGCDCVLLCLNKVAGLGLDLATELEEGESLVIPPIVETWQQQLELNGIDFSSGKFYLMATEMHGSSKAETSKMTARQRSRLKEDIEDNLEAVRVNGGQTTIDVVNWIRDQVDRIIQSRSSS
ncbi:hypothetical protein SPRG_03793 [Saprolegnia parasitica CBS 223.65]|uniref:Uncharacterized protein n=1 Tax=Saprolegnia parasitica (strain CBS 223.65) TaxID=695850 RepID=A0A067CMZ2_SAPPC|nr:hypothetical protein SPRG_03793 [Saprolegnia parasitica CBS 223.65]KDO31873.1 hypothetical protein SPRG_03793 [Saprolegnia parasitica CBS 223.65]|eukprot:XP_012197751.1 hypothetical protein SPRG_03793 [Saprolegnia parasitica CBS 223.65]